MVKTNTTKGLGLPFQLYDEKRFEEHKEMFESLAEYDRTGKLPWKIEGFDVYMSGEGEWVVATCPKLDIASQGKDMDEAEKNIKEAIQLYLEENRKVY